MKTLVVATLAALCLGLARAHEGDDLLGNAPADPDAKRPFCGIVSDKGYDCRSYNLTTEDGYILETFRVGNNDGKPVVVLWHGLLDSSFTWILNYPNQSFPYILVDRGYDVWLPNNRGNTYGKNHVSLSPKEDAFWAFSFDEYVKYDVPNVIDIILNITGQKSVSYAGHSEGTTQMFAGLSTGTIDPAKINVFLALAPVAWVGHETNIAFRALSDPLAMAVWEPLFGKKAFLSLPQYIKDMDAALCKQMPSACSDVIEFICGPHRGAFNNSRMGVMGANEPGGTSVQNMVHWAQMVWTNEFKMHDFGKKENEKHYNQSTPPYYVVENIPKSVPIALFTGSQDELADPEDVAALVKALPSPPILHQNIPQYAHLDFTWATDAAAQMYIPTMLPILEQYNPT